MERITTKEKLINKLNDKWRMHSKIFNAAIKVARSDPTLDNDQIECQYCTRKFGVKAAVRHIPVCRIKCGRR